MARLYPSKIASSEARSNAVDASIQQRSFKARQSNKGGAGKNKQSYRVRQESMDHDVDIGRLGFQNPQEARNYCFGKLIYRIKVNAFCQESGIQPYDKT